MMTWFELQYGTFHVSANAIAYYLHLILDLLRLGRFHGVAP